MTLKAGHGADLPIPTDHNNTLVVLQGEIALGDEKIGTRLSVLLAPGPEPIRITTGTDSLVPVLSGAPINEPVVQYVPFVMNTQAEVRSAMVDYNSGRFGRNSA